jgi:hypothetical protein
MDLDPKPVPWVKFEDDVFAYVQAKLGSGLLSINPGRSIAHRKRSYYSERRKACIAFEVAIEAFDEGATDPSLIWVWECKDHSQSGRRVEVSDIEILNDKVDQLGRARFKASLVTTHGFQSSAEELAKSCGISLFVLKKEMHRVLLFSRSSPRERWDERIVLSFGLTPQGNELHNGEWLEDALNHSFMEFGVQMRSVGIDDEQQISDEADPDQIIKDFIDDQKTKGVEFTVQLERAQTTQPIRFAKVLYIRDLNGHREADREWVGHQLHQYMSERNIEISEDAIEVMWRALFDAAWHNE